MNRLARSTPDERARGATGSVTSVETTGPERHLEPGQMSAIVGLFAAGCAVWFFPLAMGGLGMLAGGVAFARGERRGRWVVLIALAGLALGLLVNLLPERFVST
jgi:hypothetical protein